MPLVNSPPHRLTLSGIGAPEDLQAVLGVGLPQFPQCTRGNFDQGHGYEETQRDVLVLERSMQNHVPCELAVRDDKSWP